MKKDSNPTTSKVITVLKPITLKESAMKDLGRILIASISVDFIDATRVEVVLKENENVRRKEVLERGDTITVPIEVSLRNRR